MMISRLKLPLGYSPSLEARVLEIPFKLRRASLFIVLPDHMEQPLSALEANLTSENMRTLLSTLKTEVVNLRLPRFCVDTTMMMLKPLKVLGVSFDSSPPSDRREKFDRRIEILPDQFIHKVRVEIDEGRNNEDSEIPSTTSPPSQSSNDESFGKLGEKYFEVDHSFIFFIWDYIASTIICMGPSGRSSNPSIKRI
ncbi:Leukocyte elastase inhibitor C [Armadillidium vulgare]|nr:Leukocyte elastase inhibitor C [Armadillidium vulgare]